MYSLVSVVIHVVGIEEWLTSQLYLQKLLGHFLSYRYLVNTKTSTPLMIVFITGDSFMLHVCIVLVKIALP